MKEIRFKIYNPEVVDCSSTWAHLAPPIESIELLTNILYELLQSDLIVNIERLELNIDYNEYLPYTTYTSPKILDKYFLDVLDYNLKSYDLHQGQVAEKNKLNELYIEKKKWAEAKIKKYQEDLELKHPLQHKKLLLPPGIEGVKHAIRIIKDLNLGWEDCPVNFIMMHVDIIWKMWIPYYNSTSKQRVIYNLLRDDEDMVGFHEVENLDLNSRKRALNAFSHIGFEFHGELGFSSQLNLGKNFTYITRKHYDEILSFLKKKFNKQFIMGFSYG